MKALRRPLESAQYTSIDYTQTLDDHGVLASVGSVAGLSPRATQGLQTPRSDRGETSEPSNGPQNGLPADERAADGSLRSRYALAALTAGAQPTTIP